MTALPTGVVTVDSDINAFFSPLRSYDYGTCNLYYKYTAGNKIAEWIRAFNKESDEIVFKKIVDAGVVTILRNDNDGSRLRFTSPGIYNLKLQLSCTNTNSDTTYTLYYRLLSAGATNLDLYSVLYTGNSTNSNNVGFSSIQTTNTPDYFRNSDNTGFLVGNMVLKQESGVMCPNIYCVNLTFGVTTAPYNVILEIYLQSATTPWPGFRLTGTWLAKKVSPY